MAFIASLFFQLSIQGQDISGNTLYMQNLYGINPAYAGSGNGIFAALQSKSQYSGLEDAPRTYSFNLHAPLPHKIGLGTQIISDERGAFDYKSGELSASYFVELSDKGLLHFGLSTGFIKNSIQTSKIAINQYVNSTDPTLSSDLFNETRFRFRTGFWYQYENLDISVSFPQLMVEGKKFHEHIISMASYRFNLSQNDEWMVKPSVLYQVLPLSPDQVEVNLMGQWKNTIWLQTGYRSNKSAIVSAGVNISGIRIGYGYETANQYLSNISRGSHEVLLAINVPFKKKKELAETDITPPIESSTIAYNEENDLKFKEMENEIALLRKQLGQEVENMEFQEVDSVSENPNNYYSITLDQDGNEKREAIGPGNYIVVNTCTDINFAHHLVKIYYKKNIDAAIVFDSNKKFYYIYTKKIEGFDEAVSEMKKKRASGFKNAWVLVYK